MLFPVIINPGYEVPAARQFAFHALQVMPNARAPGAWISRDPLAEAGGINLYGYVINDPINVIDPFGLRVFQYSRGVSATGALMLGIHFEVNIGIEIDFSDLANSRIFASAETIGMMGVGEAAVAGYQQGFGTNPCPTKAGFSSTLVTHGETDIADVVGGGLSVDKPFHTSPDSRHDFISDPGANGAAQGKVLAGEAGYVGAGFGDAQTLASPSPREIWNWLTGK